MSDQSWQRARWIRLTYTERFVIGIALRAFRFKLEVEAKEQGALFLDRNHPVFTADRKIRKTT